MRVLLRRTWELPSPSNAAVNPEIGLRLVWGSNINSIEYKAPRPDRPQPYSTQRLLCPVYSASAVMMRRIGFFIHGAVFNRLLKSPRECSAKNLLPQPDFWGTQFDLPFVGLKLILWVIRVSGGGWYQRTIGEGSALKNRAPFLLRV